ncbi:hypothetical protein CW304_12045 [Bacillus sp. UFRGS-B20]|nr:hypothetical protein CW304_12045 [Bacillus sp. UFRGS-B20]
MHSVIHSNIPIKLTTNMNKKKRFQCEDRHYPRILWGGFFHLDDHVISTPFMNGFPIRNG